MLHPYLYNIRNIWDIQLQHHITTFLQRINDSHLLGISTRIRLQQLQNNLWSTVNIFEHPHPNVDGQNKHTLNFKIIQLLPQIAVTIRANPNIAWPNIIHHQLQPLEPILKQHSKYITFKKQLRRLNLLYLEQLCTSDNTTLLEWYHLSPRISHLPKGRKPIWFTELENITLENQYYRSLKPQYQHQGTNPFAYNTYNIPKKHKPWLITFNDKEIIIGKIRKRLTNSNQISITHWQTDINIHNTNYYPLQPINFVPCSGCHLNSQRLTSACTINTSSITSAQFFGRIISNSVKINANYLDLLSSAAIKWPSPNLILPPMPTIPISNFISSAIFEASETTNELNQISLNNSLQNSFNFYTDGSVIDIGTNNCTMGIG